MGSAPTVVGAASSPSGSPRATRVGGVPPMYGNAGRSHTGRSGVAGPVGLGSEAAEELLVGLELGELLQEPLHRLHGLQGSERTPQLADLLDLLGQEELLLLARPGDREAPQAAGCARFLEARGGDGAA